MNKRDRITITIKKDILRQVDALVDGDKIRNRSHAIESILNDKFGDSFVRTAVILGGGSGVKVSGYTELTSPLLSRYKKKTLIEWHIEKLKKIGVEEVILAVGVFGSDVRKFLGDGSVYDIRVLYFERDYGTASSIRQARNLLKDTFIMFNGHIVVEDVDIKEMFLAHKNSKAFVTMGLTTVANPSDYGQVTLKGSNITKYVEKPGKSKTVSYIINAGIYIINSEVCELVKPEEESLEKDIFPKLAKNNKLNGYMIDVPWQRIK